MSMWHTVLQDASFRDVHFDVVALDEQDGKALVEHARPFTDGVWLEDMGSTGRQVQVEAVFWGKGYHSRLNARRGGVGASCVGAAAKHDGSELALSPRRRQCGLCHVEHHVSRKRRAAKDFCV